MFLENESNFIERLKDKETQNSAFETLLTNYKQPLYWHIRKIVLNHDDADDVLQNTFVKIFRGITKFKGDSKLYTWMYRIATNESLNFLSFNTNVKPWPFAGVESESESSPSEEVIDLETEEVELSPEKSEQSSS